MSGPGAPIGEGKGGPESNGFGPGDRGGAEVRRGPLWLPVIWENLIVHLPKAFAHAVIKKMLRSVGVPLWKEEAAPFHHALSDPYPVPSASGEHGEHEHFKIWVYCSDGGPDQVGYRKITVGLTYPLKDPYELHIFSLCLLHCEALCVKAQLNVLDQWLASREMKWRYFSSLAKLTHLWRDKSKPIFTSWLSR